MRAGTNDQLTTEQKDLVERFLAAYTEIEGLLKHRLGLEPEKTMSQMIKQYGAANPKWHDHDGRQLRIYSTLRDALVHNERQPYEYLSVPLPSVVDRIEEINKRLTNPKMVIPEFRREVVKLDVTTTLSTVLGYIHEHKFSQFPVYDADRFRGLLTENGITQWLAGHVADSTIVEFEDEPVSKALSNEETKENYRFASRNTPVKTIVDWFGRDLLLEAVLITENGNSEQGLLGIASRWDVQEFLR